MSALHRPVSIRRVNSSGSAYVLPADVIAALSKDQRQELKTIISGALVRAYGDVEAEFAADRAVTALLEACGAPTTPTQRIQVKLGEHETLVLEGLHDVHPHGRSVLDIADDLLLDVSCVRIAAGNLQAIGCAELTDHGLRLTDDGVKLWNSRQPADTEPADTAADGGSPDPETEPANSQTQDTANASRPAGILDGLLSAAAPLVGQLADGKLDQAAAAVADLFSDRSRADRDASSRGHDGPAEEHDRGEPAGRPAPDAVRRVIDGLRFDRNPSGGVTVGVRSDDVNVSLAFTGRGTFQGVTVNRAKDEHR